MTLRVVERARQTWADIPPSDFDAVDDLVRAFVEEPAEQAWKHLDTVTRVDSGGYHIAIVRVRRVLAMIETRQPTLFAIGVPADA